VTPKPEEEPARPACRSGRAGWLCATDGSGVLRLPGHRCCHLSHFQASRGRPWHVLLRRFPLLGCDGEDHAGLKKAAEGKGSSGRRMASRSRKRWLHREPFGTYACAGAAGQCRWPRRKGAAAERLRQINNTDKQENGLFHFFFSFFGARGLAWKGIARRRGGVSLRKDDLTQSLETEV